MRYSDHKYIGHMRAKKRIDSARITIVHFLNILVGHYTRLTGNFVRTGKISVASIILAIAVALHICKNTIGYKVIDVPIL